LLAVVFDSRLAVVSAVSIALLGGCILDFDFEFVALTVFAGTLAAFSVRGIRTRGQFMVAAGVVLLTYIATLSVFQLFKVFDLDRFLMQLALVFGNAILLLLALPLLWIFERIFRITTDVTLLELSDTNQPLLRDLSMLAPGSFSHSLQVANLAEAGADAIGANALLTRVGALYHDIGKTLKPEYFVENQAANSNPHDDLTPKMSALVIAAHVKDGLELARQWRLPQVIVDFIPMHHGTTRIEFFYSKALELHKDDVLESDFRYPGPKPRTKETGILMLADSVEAASKSVAGSGRATPKRFETLVDSLFRARLEDGQLDACPLTLADLTRIRDTFVSMLSGMYHFRVKYPGQKAEEDSEKEDEGLESSEGQTAAGESGPRENSDGQREVRD
jgi:putative nucleotidyltransferase with HDIG domain